MPLVRVVCPRSVALDKRPRLRSAGSQFALDQTAGQTTTLYVACEKDALRAQLTGWLEDMGVPVLVV
ncbi:hypothetical protein ACWC0C_46460 [Streptomyces sp. NPDC001709]